MDEGRFPLEEVEATGRGGPVDKDGLATKAAVSLPGRSGPLIAAPPGVAGGLREGTEHLRGLGRSALVSYFLSPYEEAVFWRPFFPEM